MHERYNLKLIDVLSEQSTSHTVYLYAKTVKEVKTQLLRNLNSNIEAVFYRKSSDDYEVYLNENELLKVNWNSNSVNEIYCTFFRINYNAHGEKTSLQSNTYSCSRKGNVINLPRIRVCVNDKKLL